MRKPKKPLSRSRKVKSEPLPKVRSRKPKSPPPVPTLIWDTDDRKVSVLRPPNVGYQWIAHEVMGMGSPAAFDRARMEKSGWKIVPLKRHAGDIPIEFHGPDGTISFQGLTLYEKDADEIRAAHVDVWARAREMLGEYEQALGMEKGEGKGFWIMSPAFVQADSYDRVASDAPPVDVDVTIRLRMSGRFQDVANALKMSVKEYAQRRLQLLASGEISGLLLPVEDSGSRDTPFLIREISLTEVKQ